MNNHIMHVLTAALLLVFPLLARADVSLTTESKDGKTCYRMDNGRISLLVSPDHGGAVTSYKDRLGANVDLVAYRNAGLCYDHFDAQSWPGEMFNARYEVVAQKNDPQASSLTVRYTTTGNWNGFEAKLANVLLEKTYTLRADSPALECRIKITAPEKETKLLGYWQQHIFFPGGQYDADTVKTFRPSTRGVRVKSAGPHDGATGAEAFLSDFTAGWSAMLDTTRKCGLLALADYNELGFLYDCANSTVEPMFRLTFFPPGKSVEYTTYVVPVVGLDNVVSATLDYIAGYAMKSDGKGTGTLNFSVIRSVNAPASLALSAGVMNVQKPEQVVSAGTLTFAALSEQAQRGELSFTNAGEDPLVLKVASTVKEDSGATVAGKFEDYYNGAYRYGENITVDMTSPVYRGERPKQILTLLKPTPLKLKATPTAQIWYAESVLDDYYHLGPAVHMLYLGGDNGKNFERVFTSASQWGLRLNSFPYDYDKLLSYKLLILGGIKNDTLGNLGQEMFCDFINAGGAILMLGGPGAYGPSALRGTPLADLLPVTINPRPFDLLKLPTGVIKPTREGAPFLEDLDWSKSPVVMYVHNVEVKPWGKVVLEADGHPFLVIGEVGPQKARVACILGTPLGDFDAKQLPFYAWSDWSYLLRQLMWWQLKEDVRFAKE